MKKILTLIVVVFFTTITFGQDIKHKVKKTPYIGGGLSMTNSDTFEVSSYPSIEAGVMIKNMTFAGVFGRNNLHNTFVDDSFNNYWYEAKIAFSKQIGYVSGYGVFGIGNYIGTNQIFIEYGFGISKEFTDNFGGFMQVSNWDGTTYLTPGFYVSF